MRPQKEKAEKEKGGKYVEFVHDKKKISDKEGCLEKTKTASHLEERDTKNC